MGTSWLSVAVVVQDGDSMLLLVVAVFLCWVVVKISLLVVARILLLVVVMVLLLLVVMVLLLVVVLRVSLLVVSRISLLVVMVSLLGGDGRLVCPQRRRPSGAARSAVCEAQEIGSSYFCTEQGADINEQLINIAGLDGCSVSVPN